jgi:hypothetical protein
MSARDGQQRHEEYFYLENLEFTANSWNSTYVVREFM